MNAFDAALESGLLIFLDLVLRATVVLFITAGCAWLFKKRSALVRRNVWVAGILTVVLLPLFAMFGPRIPMAFEREDLAVNSVSDSAETVVPIQLSASKRPIALTESSSIIEPEPATVSSDVEIADVQATTMKSAEATTTVNWYAGLSLILLIGITFRLARMAISAWSMQQLLRLADSSIPAAWQRAWDESVDDMGLRSPVTLRQSSANIAPLACGVVRPSVLFPQAAHSWSEARRRAVMLHELAHVRQRDVAVILLSQFVCAFLFFHPLAWLAVRKLRHECERACDDLVLNSGQRPSDYASHLMAIARSLHDRRNLTTVAVAMSQSSNLKGRISAILDSTTPRDVPRSRHTLIAAGLAMCFGVALASPQFAQSRTPVSNSRDAIVVEKDERPTQLSHQQHRNNAFTASDAPDKWDVDTGNNVRWSAKLGSQTASSPVVANGKIFIGTNNRSAHVKRLPKEKDLGCLLAFDEESGELLWQYSAEKLASGRVNDWPGSGITATPYADGDRVWIVNNRAEVVCLDANGFRDNENDGEVVDEPRNIDEADIVWSLDLMKELGTFPHNHSDCGITSDGKLLFIVVPNGVDASHLDLPSGSSPAFVAIDRTTGKVAWKSSVDCSGVLHAQWSSAALASVNGRIQVICPGGDGWLYGLDSESGNTIWKFDCNPKDAVWHLGGRGRRNNLVGMPLFYDGLIYMTTGQDPEHGEGQGDVWCIDPTGVGDVSSMIGDEDGFRRNSNSRAIWHFEQDTQPNESSASFSDTFHRSLSTPAAKDGLLIVPDLAGQVHCFDAKTGRRHAVHDLFASCWASPLIVKDRVYIADEDGDVAVFNLSPRLEPVAEQNFDRSIYTTPTFSNGTLFVASKSHLYAIESARD